jgi:hypothetical protein
LKSALGGDLSEKAADLGNLFLFASRSELMKLSFDDLKLACSSEDTFSISPSIAQVINQSINQSINQ